MLGPLLGLAFGVGTLAGAIGWAWQFLASPSDTCREARRRPEFAQMLREHEQQAESARARLAARYATIRIGASADREVDLALREGDDQIRLQQQLIDRWDAREDAYCWNYGR